MTLVVLAGVGFGCGIAAAWHAAFRPRRTLDAAIGAVESNGTHGAFDAVDSRAPKAWRFDHVIGMRLATVVRAQSSGGALAGMLATTGEGLDQLCAEAALGSLVGIALPLLCWVLASVVNVRVPILVPIWSALVLGAGGGLVPLLVLRSESTKRRRLARRVIGCYLDLVVLCLAAGMGVEGALLAAAQVGQDDLSRRVGGTLELARDSATPPWTALSRLGDELGIPELREVAAAVGLAGTEGAQIRATLVAKAASVRRHELSESEAQANAVTQRLFLPGSVLLLGFLLFIGYPAVERILSGL